VIGEHESTARMGKAWLLGDPRRLVLATDIPENKTNWQTALPLATAETIGRADHHGFPPARQQWAPASQHVSTPVRYWSGDK